MKKFFISSIILMFILSFPVFSYADDFNDNQDETLHPFKIAAYALYPAGFVLENLVERPVHWLMSLPFLKDLSGHEELNQCVEELYACSDDNDDEF